jgi:hypothetical protein
MISQDLSILKNGQVAIKGEFMWGSNYTFAVEVTHQDQILQAVYKPTRGERPLWDFPRASLARREVAAFLVSEALDWDLVPPTVYRKDGPAGPGSLQLFVEHDPEYNYFNFNAAHLERLRPVAVFDMLINNADRKGSHVLIDEDDHMWLIDHGISFHRENKLRTVIWDFVGEPIPDDLCQALSRLEAHFKPGTEFLNQLEIYLSPQEISALADRTRKLMATRQFPNPHPNRRPYPWPPI